MLEAIGYTGMMLAFFGIPFALVGYGAYIALRRGIGGQPEDTQATRSRMNEDKAA